MNKFILLLKTACNNFMLFSIEDKILALVVLVILLLLATAIFQAMVFSFKTDKQ